MTEILQNDYNDSEKLVSSDFNLQEKSNLDIDIKESAETKIKNLTTKKIIGYCLLIFVVLSTVVSSIWLKFIQTNVKTFLMTYINYSFLSILIPVSWLKNKIKKYREEKSKNESKNTNNSISITQETEQGDIKENLIQEEKDYKSYFHWMCLILMFYWINLSAFYNLGLIFTSITSANTLSNMSVVWILSLKVLFFKSKCSKYRIIGLILCMGGVLLLSYFDSSVQAKDKNDSFWGDVYIILACFFYSVYSLMIKKYSKKYKTQFDMTEVFGYMGFYIFLIIPIFLVIFHFTGIEKFEMPSLLSVFYIFINAFVAGILADLAQNYTMILLSPHIVSFALVFTSPLSYLYDILAGNITLNWYYAGGSILIVSSLSLIVYESYLKLQNKKEKILKEQQDVAKNSSTEL